LINVRARDDHLEPAEGQAEPRQGPVGLYLPLNGSFFAGSTSPGPSFASKQYFMKSLMAGIFLLRLSSSQGRVASDSPSRRLLIMAAVCLRRGVRRRGEDRQTDRQTDRQKERDRETERERYLSEFEIKNQRPALTIVNGRKERS
jgi:hypothetical protein